MALPEPPPPPAPKTTAAASSDELKTLSARLRLAEERHSELRKMIALIEQNMIANNKKTQSAIKDLTTEINEMKHSTSEVELRITSIINELSLTVKKEDLDVLKRYIELWNPTTFVTADRVEDLINELIEQKQKKAPE